MKRSFEKAKMGETPLTMDVKRQRIYQLIEVLERKHIHAERNDMFKNMLQAACSWCTRTFDLKYKLRIDSFLMICENLEDFLQIMGDDSTDVYFLVRKHPKLSCPFVEDRVRHLVFHDEEEYNKQSEESRRISDYILKRGFHNKQLIRNVLRAYIREGKRVTLSKEILKNQTISIAHFLTKSTNESEIDRYLECYRAYRRHIYQYHYQLVDDATVVVIIKQYYLPMEDNEKMAIQTNGYNALSIAFPDCRHRESRRFIKDRRRRIKPTKIVSDENCYHTSLKYEQILTIINKLRQSYNVQFICKPIHSSSICKCQAIEDLPRLPRSGSVLPTTASKIVQYVAPRGLKALCLSAMRHEWNWKAMDVERALPDKLTDYYFGSGDMNSSPMGF